MARSACFLGSTAPSFHVRTVRFGNGTTTVHAQVAATVLAIWELALQITNAPAVFKAALTA